MDDIIIDFACGIIGYAFGIIVGRRNSVQQQSQQDQITMYMWRHKHINSISVVHGGYEDDGEPCEYR